jgi:hypothetical protein
MIVLLTLPSQDTWSHPGVYTEEMFRRAMAEDNIAVSGSVSLSPLYVLITVRDAETGHDRQTCTLSTNLMAAIAEEYHLDLFSDARKIFDIAIAAPNRVFTFKNEKAREIVAPAYTSQELAAVQKSLGGKSRKELCREANVDLSRSPDRQSSLTKIYRRNKGNEFWSSASYRVAVAHVLLEHGILVGEAHDTGTLFVHESWCRHQ